MIKKAALTQVINKSITLSCGRGIPLRDASACVDAVFDTLAEALSRGERIELRGFGSFSVKDVPQKKYPSSLNGNQNHVVPAHGKIVFKPANKLRLSVWNKVKL